MSDKTILEQWRAIAYDQQADRNKLQQFWAKYFNIEKNIYAQLLENPDEVVTGTVKELAEKYNQEVLTMVGFLDGINDSLKVQNPIETMDENTTVSLCFDKELLYKNMVDAKADWLYNLNIDRDPVDSGCGDGLQWWMTARQSVSCIFIGKLVDL